MRISFLNPGSLTEAFFGKMSAFMQIAAEQLGVDLEIIECHRQKALMFQEGKALLTRSRLPEYLILVNEESMAVDLLPRAVAAGMKVFLINSGFTIADQDRLGRPGERLEGWLGELLPDDRQAGFLLADRLIEVAAKEGKSSRDSRIHLGGIAGGYSTDSNLRVTGLREAVGAHTGASLNVVALGDWDKARAAERTTDLLKRFPETTVVWAASDLMAAGAIEAIEGAGLVPGRDVLVGGVDWAPLVYEKIQDRTLTASVGGHFMEGAWALVMLYDHHHGKPLQAAEARSGFVALTYDNLKDYSLFFDEKRWREADFQSLSKARNPVVKAYDFSLRSAFR